MKSHSPAEKWVDEFERTRRTRLAGAFSLATLAAVLTVVRVSAGIAKPAFMVAAIGIGLAAGVAPVVIRRVRAREISIALPAPGFLVAHLDHMSGPQYAVAMADRDRIYLMAVRQNGAPYAERSLSRSRLRAAERGRRRCYLRICTEGEESLITLRVPRRMLRELAKSHALEA